MTYVVLKAANRKSRWEFKQEYGYICLKLVVRRNPRCRLRSELHRHRKESLRNKCDLVIPLLSIYTRDMRICTSMKICTLMFMAALFLLTNG